MELVDTPLPSDQRPLVLPASAESPPEVSLRKKPFALEYRCLADIVAEQVDWVWYPYVPAGALTLMFGRGGLGKSWITCSMAADLSQGRKLPGQETALAPQKILMVSAEDDAARVIKPRMVTLQANMANIFVSEQPFILDEKGIRGLEGVMNKVSATIVFLDPLVSYLGGRMDINKSNETRAMMGPLAKAAAQTGCAVVVVHHVRKDNKGRMIHNALGSADFGNSVRSALVVEETKAGQKFMSHVKHNWSMRGDSLAYGLEQDHFFWDGVFHEPDSDHMPQSARPRHQMTEFLHDLLKDGPRPANEVLLAAKAAGHNERTLNRAKIGIARSRRVEGVWIWELIDRQGLGDVLLPQRVSQTPRPPAVSLSPAVQEMLDAARAKLDGTGKPAE